MTSELKYDIELPAHVSYILEQDFWMYEHLNGAALQGRQRLVKFSSCVSVYVRRGECRVEINLVQYHIKAPCMVTIAPGHILHASYVSSDFDASFMVLSKRMTDSLFMYLNSAPEFVLAHRHVVVPIAPEDTEAFDRHYATLKAITNDSENSHLYHAICFELVAFFFRTTYKCYRSFSEQVKHQKSFVSQQFLLLAQTHFRHERFLDFYAAQLGLTKKHMSRTVKEQTGYTAVEWIERFIILEAKVMLKSSTLTIQQIAEELHFPSQSLFGKYFKKNVGMTPKEYRNH